MPVDRFGRKRKDFAKVALGVEEMVGWELLDGNGEAVRLIKKLKKDGFTVVALEQADGSVDYKKVRVKNKTLVIVGNEVSGVSKGLLKLADKIAEIPIQGKKESLNAAVAAGIFLYRVLDG